MTSVSEYAQLALLVYDVHDNNRIKIPSSAWNQLEYFPDNSDGFSYGVYEKGTEIVIAFTGTNCDVMSGDVTDWLANAGNGSGLGSDQLNQAALVAARIISGYSGKTITFTGHSLGGGLAAVMGIWFDKPATVFDEAPFMYAAISPVAYNAAQDYVKEMAFLIDNPTFFGYDALDYPSRAGNVTNYYVPGEAMEVLKVAAPILTHIPLMSIGSSVSVDFGHNLTGGFQLLNPVKLHAQTLMAVGWMAPSLREATQAVTNFLPAAFDSRLYGVSDRKSAQKDFLTKLIQSEQANPGSGNLSHLVTDLNTLGNNQSQLNDEAKDAIAALPTAKGYGTVRDLHHWSL